MTSSREVIARRFEQQRLERLPASRATRLDRPAATRPRTGSLDRRRAGVAEVMPLREHLPHAFGRREVRSEVGAPAVPPHRARGLDRVGPDDLGALGAAPAVLGLDLEAAARAALAARRRHAGDAGRYVVIVVLVGGLALRPLRARVGDVVARVQAPAHVPGQSAWQLYQVSPASHTWLPHTAAPGADAVNVVSSK
jgi:hypothetical protein